MYLAAGLAFFAFSLVPQDLDVHTDVIGYPTYANFNVNRYFWAYGFVVVFFPLATFAIYLALTRAFGRSRVRLGTIPPPLEDVETILPVSARRAPLVAAGRMLLVGGVLGLETAIISATARAAGMVLLAAAGYAAAVLLVSVGASRLSSRAPLELARLVNTLAASLTVALLYGVSESTQVTVASTGAVHRYPWLPVWLAAALTVGVLVWLVRGLQRGTTRSDRADVERRALLLVVGPVGLFLLLAYLPGDLGAIHLFEEGQLLTAAELTRDGGVPWRDLLIVHGPLHDVGPGVLGSTVVEDSRWGLVAAEKLLILPLSWVGLYYLCAYLFGSNWLFLLGTQLVVVTGSIFAIQYRFALIPFVLLLLAALLHRPTVVRAVAFATLLFVQVVVTPEAILAAPIYLLVVFLFELYYREQHRRIVDTFRRTMLALTTAGVLALGWSIFLEANGVLDDFVFSYTAFARDLQLAGGIPLGIYRPINQDQVAVGQHYEELAILAPVVLVLGTMLFFVVRMRLRIPLALQDWVVLAAAAFVLPYYTKFLARSDHIYQVFALTVPVLLYAVFRVVSLAEARLASAARRRIGSWFPARHAITLPLLLILVATAPVALRDVVRSVPHRFAAAVAEEPELELVGFARRGANDTAMFRDVSRALATQIEPGEAVFDFSNTPGLFHYLLGVPPSNRYFTVSIAIREETQTDLIRLLEAKRPKIVVLSAGGRPGSLAVWDQISNQVRHYDVSEYLLDQYVPVLETHGFVLMRRREDGISPRPELYFHSPPCDWGHVPNFFRPSPAAKAEVLNVPFRALDPVLRIRGWAVDREARTPAKEVVVTRDGKVIARARPNQRRPDVSFELSDPAYRDSGFGVAAPFSSDSDADLDGVRVHAIMQSGEAMELVLAPGADPERAGGVEAADVEKPLALHLPAYADTYRWLEVRTGEPLQRGVFELSDRLEESPLGPRMISFKTLDRGETLTRVRVGACSQWRGYRADSVYLMPSAEQDIREIRLLR